MMMATLFWLSEGIFRRCHARHAFFINTHLLRVGLLACQGSACGGPSGRAGPVTGSACGPGSWFAHCARCMGLTGPFHAVPELGWSRLVRLTLAAVSHAHGRTLHP